MGKAEGGAGGGKGWQASSVLTSCGMQTQARICLLDSPRIFFFGGASLGGLSQPFPFENLLTEVAEDKPFDLLPTCH